MPHGASQSEFSLPVPSPDVRSSSLWNEKQKKTLLKKKSLGFYGGTLNSRLQSFQRKKKKVEMLHVSAVNITSGEQNNEFVAITNGTCQRCYWNDLELLPFFFLSPILERYHLIMKHSFYLLTFLLTRIAFRFHLLKRIYDYSVCWIKKCGRKRSPFFFIPCFIDLKRSPLSFTLFLIKSQLHFQAFEDFFISLTFPFTKN